MKVMGFDTECVRLAQHFLRDYENVTLKDIDNLAREFQKTAEDWFLVHPDLLSKS